MQLRYNYRVYPTSGQQQALARAFVSCPEGPPRAVRPVEIPGSTQDDLRRVLSGHAAPTEQGVRAALAGLDLDPLIIQQVAAVDGVVGVALRGSQYDCLLARVDGERAEVWRPSRVQLAPGELSCTADVAARGLGQRPPH
ncbi:helix-turn-helix domain-containing protein [Micromonospora sp. B11E3]|uniref:helix-turn-helix domain-containing protein n=1 Tax=Micromonospora sp. B11E3 TaxID=3153562 RepID=UPI00325F917E